MTTYKGYKSITGIILKLKELFLSRLISERLVSEDGSPIITSSQLMALFIHPPSPCIWDKLCLTTYKQNRVEVIPRDFRCQIRGLPHSTFFSWNNSFWGSHQLCKKSSYSSVEATWRGFYRHPVKAADMFSALYTRLATS